MKSLCFQKSSYSSGNGECVEVARNVPGAIAVRDSKRATGGVLVVAPASWDAFQRELSRPSGVGADG
ncbi:DUF397 domain-containing protein [Streptomyces sp. A1277]|uniref:DUF397 domain-containing protein n=1 Tax=Streptomyces sp. A1277 TaxID=2563103 RepID=UPI0010A26025|nr:DUF397 domain-containing protein [Streptomyces sp. A1277]THA31109.1 DUF397 domain-containing protein [Streptomyces sp. A1277]